MRRRTFLAGVSTGVVASVSGCLETVPLIGQSERRYEAVEGDYEFDGGTFTVTQTEARWMLWFDDDRGGVWIEYFADAQRAVNFFEGKSLTEEMRTFIIQTDYDTERLLVLASSGTPIGFKEVMVQSLSVTGDTLVGSATAYAEHTPGASAVSYPVALVRVTFDSEPVENAEFTITTGHGKNHIGGGTEYTRRASTQNE